MNEIKTCTELNDNLIRVLNESHIPFDAKVFVMRSLMSEMEIEYSRFKTQLKESSSESKN